MYLLNEFANRYVKEQYKKRKIPFRSGGFIYTQAPSQKEEYRLVKQTVLNNLEKYDPKYKYKNHTANLYSKLTVRNNTNNIKYNMPTSSKNAGSFKDLSKVEKTLNTTVTSTTNPVKVNTSTKLPKTKLLTKNKIALAAGLVTATGIGLLAANKLRKSRSDKNKKRNKYNKRK